jgi:putative cell wall-binding protein
MYQGADHVTGVPRAGQGARRGVVRRWAALAIPLVMFLLTMGVSTLPSAGVVSAASVNRVTGADRYQTAVDVARVVGGGSLTGLDRLILVTGERFPDGLVASGLAGYLDEGGRSGRTAILLTQIESLPAAVAQAITASGVAASDVVVVGGPSAVSAGVHAAIARAAGWNGQGTNPVTRIAGQTRYETAAVVVDYVADAAGGGLADSYRTVLVANGENFPDALAGGALAYRNGHLLVLSRPPAAPAVSRDAIGELDANCAVLLGGPVALSVDVGVQVNDELSGQGCGTDRLGGADRYATAASIANRMRTTAGSPTSVVLTSGTNFTDALVAAPLAASNTPILFTSPRGLPAATTAWLQANRGTLTQIQILGGTSAVPQTVANAAAAAATGSSDDNGGGGGSGGDAAATWPALAGGAEPDEGYSIAALADGSGAIVTGVVKGLVNFGEIEIETAKDDPEDPDSSYTEAAFVAKVDASGEWVWALGTTGDGAEGNGVVTLADGSAIVVGNFFNNITFAADDMATGPAITFGDSENTLLNEIFVARVTPEGEWAWAIKAGGDGQDYGRGISVTTDKSGVIITGSDSGNVYVARVATADGTIVWEATATSGEAEGTSVSILPEGAGAIVVGEYYETVTFNVTIGALTPVKSGVFVARIDSAGEWQWASKVDGPEYDNGRSVSVLADGTGAIVTGSFDTGATFSAVNPGAITLTSGGVFDEDLYVAKIDADGEWVWAVSAGGSGRDLGRAVMAQGDGSAIVSGYTRSTTATFGTVALTRARNRDAFVAKISAAGVWEWAVSTGGPSSASEANGLAILNGKILITGYFSGEVSFGETSVSSAGGNDIFVARLSDAGVFG